jgi:hypothetical protein
MKLRNVLVAGAASAVAIGFAVLPFLLHKRQQVPPPALPAAV